MSGVIIKSLFRFTERIEGREREGGVDWALIDVM